ncbi:unnamed protein product [Rotaria socialis]|uniref:Reverse transcriptase/retrotransposon-derived protein RNase H-like domain-containing protein n=1 Tax=Rotaria socialis TaxID=392032 RepID=A0A821SBD6_9BILA|nr:unnamed protein product [Rotaria socialis]CAF4856583.1 unnamed protein product [Rotaria socialis]
MRFCVDYRRLNQITTKDAFPLPRIDDIYDQLTTATYFTKFDFKVGYFQVPLDKADRPKTAFSTRDGHFQFKLLPQVARSEILFLGHLIKEGFIKPDPNNIRGLVETKEPTTAEEAFRFVRAAEYYREFIPKFSIIAAPLHRYSPSTLNQQKMNKSKFVLSDDARTAFHELKKILTTDLILGLPDDTLQFKIQSDASVDGIGAVLLQITPNGDRPLAYMSKKLMKTQTNWSTIEQECYAIVQAIDKWDKYLRGHEFILETDHEPLVICPTRNN